jgi:hypothetical protein
MSIKGRSSIKFLAAAIIYAVFAVYLYQPYFKGFNALQLRDFFVVNVCLGSLGCYVLSRRWVAGFGESLFAGAIYGFGPFILGLAKFHPTAGFLAAAIPWLFCPAAFGPKEKWRWLRIPLAVLPFLAIVLFFQVSTHYRLFPVSTQVRLHLADLIGLFAPLITAKQNTTLIGFYHIPIAALIMGFSMLLAARRFSIITIFAIGIILWYQPDYLVYHAYVVLLGACGCRYAGTRLGWLCRPRMGPGSHSDYVHPCHRNITAGNKILSDIFRNGGGIRKTLYRSRENVCTRRYCSCDYFLYDTCEITNATVATNCPLCSNGGGHISRRKVYRR